MVAIGDSMGHCGGGWGVWGGVQTGSVQDSTRARLACSYTDENTMAGQSNKCQREKKWTD